MHSREPAAEQYGCFDTAARGAKEHHRRRTRRRFARSPGACRTSRRLWSIGSVRIRRCVGEFRAEEMTMLSSHSEGWLFLRGSGRRPWAGGGFEVGDSSPAIEITARKAQSPSARTPTALTFRRSSGGQAPRHRSRRRSTLCTSSREFYSPGTRPTRSITALIRRPSIRDQDPRCRSGGCG
jgi:hypothetical protein